MPWTRSTPPAPCWPPTTSPNPASTATGKLYASCTSAATVNLFKSLILTADDELREQFRGRSTVRQLQRAAALVGNTAGSTLERLRRTQLRVLAEQIQALDRMLKANLADIRALVQTMCPALLEQPGIGPVTAAIALTAWSHHGRFRSEAAFAALAGVSPVPAS